MCSLESESIVTIREKVSQKLVGMRRQAGDILKFPR